MSGIIAVYGLVIAVLIAGDLAPPPTQNTSLYTYVRLQSQYVGYVDIDGFIQGIYASGFGTVGWSGRCGSGLYYWDCRGRGKQLHIPCGLGLDLTATSGCSCLHATIPGICRNDSDPDFRRSSGTLRVCHFKNQH